VKSRICHASVKTARTSKVNENAESLEYHAYEKGKKKMKEDELHCRGENTSISSFSGLAPTVIVCKIMPQRR
jgi:hypothetical protein